MIEIVSYQPTWPGEFQAIGRVLREALGDLALRIDHIGSTSVPGLAAKDRIDIQITVRSLDPLVERAFNCVGYQRYPILFRDFLRANPAAAFAYAQVKSALAKDPADNVDAYYDIKNPACDIIMAGAELWAEKAGWLIGPSDC